MSRLFNIFLVAAAVVLIFDRWLKILVQKFPQREFFAFGDWLVMRLATNSGVAFGWGAHLNNIIICLAAAVLILILIFLFARFYRRGQRPEAVCLWLIILGAVANLYDRARYGAVIDYWGVKGFSIFNLADAMITAGAVMLVVLLLRKK